MRSAASASSKSNKSAPHFRPSLDRIEPDHGYVKGNVRIVAFIVNLAMNEWGEEALWRLVESMAEKLEVRRPSANIRDAGRA